MHILYEIQNSLHKVYTCIYIKFVTLGQEKQESLKNIQKTFVIYYAFYLFPPSFSFLRNKWSAMWNLFVPCKFTVWPLYSWLL